MGNARCRRKGIGQADRADDEQRGERDEEMNDVWSLVAASRQRIEESIVRYDPKLVVGLFSGGHDSLTANLVASRASRFHGCLHVNTGIGIEATREFVRQTCRREQWRLWEYKATENKRADGNPDPMNYDELVLRYGFPGPAAHRFMYIKLKQRCVEAFLRDVSATPKSPVLFISGARTEESQRRMGTTNTEPDERGRSVWLNAIHDWTKSDTNLFIDELKVPRNPVVDLIHKSGECLCGAFAQRGELDELKQWPMTRAAYDRISELQLRVRGAGFPWGWEESPPEWWTEKQRGQMFLLDFDDPEAGEMPLCWSCNSGRK